MKPSLPVTFEVFHEEANRFIRNREEESTVHPRSLILKLGVLVGQLCSSVLTHASMDNDTEKELESEEIRSSMGRLLFGLCVASKVCQVELRTAILNKMELNGRKYPVELCKGKAGKYTLYSNETGITKTEGQRTPTSSPTKSKENSTSTTIQGITDMISDFATERNWYKYHTPRSLVLALMGELGELAELFQWKGDDFLIEDFNEEEKDHVGQEFADVTIYLLRLAHVCRVDIGKEALRQVRGQPFE